MQEAINEALKGIKKGHGGPFGSVIVKDGEIVAKGHNLVLKNNDPTAHGEVTTIRLAGKKMGSFDLKGCELYTTAEPCLMCLGACLWANIDKVYFGCTVNDTNDLGFRDDIFDLLLDIDRTKAKESMLLEMGRDECLELFKQYQELEAKNY